MRALALLASAAYAQDPAHGWMAYAVGTLPDHYERITRLEMTWTVGAEPSHSRAFSPPAPVIAEMMSGLRSSYSFVNTAALYVRNPSSTGP